MTTTAGDAVPTVAGFVYHSKGGRCTTCGGYRVMLKPTDGGLLCPACDATWPHARHDRRADPLAAANHAAAQSLRTERRETDRQARR